MEYIVHSSKIDLSFVTNQPKNIKNLCIDLKWRQCIIFTYINNELLVVMQDELRVSSFKKKVIEEKLQK